MTNIQKIFLIFSIITIVGISAPKTYAITLDDLAKEISALQSQIIDFRTQLLSAVIGATKPQADSSASRNTTGSNTQTTKRGAATAPIPVSRTVQKFVVPTQPDVVVRPQNFVPSITTSENINIDETKIVAPISYIISSNKSPDSPEYIMIKKSLDTAYAKVGQPENIVQNIGTPKLSTNQTIKNPGFLKILIETARKVISPVSKQQKVYWIGGQTNIDPNGTYTGVIPLFLFANYSLSEGFIPNNSFSLPNGLNTSTSNDMINWSYSSTRDPIKGRYNSAGAYFGNKLYIASGWVGSIDGSCPADVWSSVNGKGWNENKEIPAWGGRSLHTLTVLGNKMYLIGGIICDTGNGNTTTGDVWVTENGENWTLLTQNNPVLGLRMGHTTVSMNGKLYVMGGFKVCSPVDHINCGYVNDVVSSVDGVNWVLEEDHAPWAQRSDHMSWVSRDGSKMYVAGGYNHVIPGFGDVWADASVPNPVGIIDQTTGIITPIPPALYNDIWSSTDGIHWSQVTSQAEWIWRRGAAGFVSGSAYYVFGGSKDYGATNFLNDVWKSTDGGTHWSQTGNLNPSHQVISGHTAIVVPNNFGASITGEKPTVYSLASILPSNSSDPTTLQGQLVNNPLTTQPVEAWFSLKNQQNNQISETTLQTVQPGIFTNPGPVLSSGNYYVTAVAKNIIGTVRSNSLMNYGVNCQDGNPHIWVTSPSASEIFYRGDTIDMTWSSCNMNSSEPLVIKLFRSGPPGGYLVSPVQTMNDGNEQIYIPSNYTISTHYYYLSLVQGNTIIARSGIFEVYE